MFPTQAPSLEREHLFVSFGNIYSVDLWSIWCICILHNIIWIEKANQMTDEFYVMYFGYIDNTIK